MSDNLATEVKTVISVQEIKDFVPITGNRDDKRLNRLCTLASGNVEAMCNGTVFLQRTFSEDYGAGIVGRLGGIRRLRLHHGPIVSVDTITDDDSNTIASTDYTIVNNGYTDSYLEHDTLWPAPVGRWTIVYDAGIWADTDDVALDVKEAALHEARLLRNPVDGTVGSVSLSGRSGSKSVTKTMPGAVLPIQRRLLWRYMRRTV